MIHFVKSFCKIKIDDIQGLLLALLLKILNTKVIIYVVLMLLCMQIM